MNSYISSSAAVLCAVLATVAVAGPITYVETFDDGQNHTAWTWDRTALGSVQDEGGNPNGYFESALMAVPSLFSSHDTFTGNFRERGVGSIGGDLATIEFASAAGNISIALANHNGTPDNPFDDTFASLVTTLSAPVNPTFGWVSFDVDIPSNATSTPAGWMLTGVLPSIPATVEWSTLITNVDEVILSWSNPLAPTLLFDVVRGADNLRINYNIPAPGAAALLGLGGLGAMRRRRRG